MKVYSIKYDKALWKAAGKVSVNHAPAQCGHVHIRPSDNEFETGAGHKTWEGYRK